MNEAEQRHWQKVSLWLAVLSLIPTGVVLYAATTDWPHSHQAWQITETTIVGACIAGTLWATGAAVKALQTNSTKKWARHAAVAFTSTACGMVAMTGVRIATTLIATAG